MIVECSLTDCIRNDNGRCEANKVYISGIDDGWPRCMDVLWPDDLAVEPRGKSDLAFANDAGERR